MANQQQTIAQRQADIASAQAKVDQIQAEYDLSVAESKRYSQLGSSGAASQSEQDKAFANERNNLALLKQALANLSVAKEALKRRKWLKSVYRLRLIMPKLNWIRQNN